MDDKVLEFPNYIVYYPGDVLFDLNDITKALLGMCVIFEQRLDRMGVKDLALSKTAKEVAFVFNYYIINGKSVDVAYYFYDESSSKLVFTLDSEEKEE